MKGQVVSINKGQYEVEVDKKIFNVRAAGKLRYENTNILVGDFVTFTPNEFIFEVHERKNELIRPKVANVDQAIIVTSLIEPNYSSILLNKFLAIIEFNDIEPIIVFTKSDLTNETHKEEYMKQGYKVFEIDNITKKGIKDLSKIFKNKLSVFTGQTGAGKSTTINSISGFELKTDEISKSLGRGKHTTRIVKIYNWMNGKLIDTPGFSSLEFNFTKHELSRAYRDFRRYSAKCKFHRNCIHNLEPDCEVKRQVENKNITIQRYKDYLRLLEEAK